MSTLRWINVALRAAMELGVVAGFAVWGWTHGGVWPMRLVIAIVLPSVVFGIWGVVDFRRAGRAAEPLRLAEELLISGVAAVALWRTGQPAWAIALALLSVVHHALVYLLGDRLLKDRENKP